MGKRIALIVGHPDPRGARFGRALAEAYAQGAREGGHELRSIDIAAIEFPLLRSKDDWDKGALPESLRDPQEAIGWAEHIVLVFPLWLGTMPALLKAFLEQVLRPGFAIARAEAGAEWERHLAGKSARLVVTMGMPALLYKWYFGAHGVKGMERNVLAFCGIRPIRETLIGMVEVSAPARERWLAKLRELGKKGL
jgi:putative NADPH-quinone reductase